MPFCVWQRFTRIVLSEHNEFYSRRLAGVGLSSDEQQIYFEFRRIGNDRQHLPLVGSGWSNPIDGDHHRSGWKTQTLSSRTCAWMITINCDLPQLWFTPQQSRHLQFRLSLDTLHSESRVCMQRLPLRRIGKTARMNEIRTRNGHKTRKIIIIARSVSFFFGSVRSFETTNDKTKYWNSYPNKRQREREKRRRREEKNGNETECKVTLETNKNELETEWARATRT